VRLETELGVDGGDCGVLQRQPVPDLRRDAASRGSDLGPAWDRAGLKGLYRDIVGLATKAPRGMLVLGARASICSC
jgi:hypothetical protein